MKKLSLLLLILLVFAACNRSTPEKRLHDLLTDRMETLVTAESCTGGTIAARFTALPGASAYFTGGIVAYSIETKRALLAVSSDTIARYGTVSEQVVRQMAEGARHVAGAHYAIATTGIAGPSGGTPEQPVGTVWIAVSSPLRTTTRLIHADGDRAAVIREAGDTAMIMLEEEIAGCGDKRNR